MKARSKLGRTLPSSRGARKRSIQAPHSRGYPSAKDLAHIKPKKPEETPPPPLSPRRHKPSCPSDPIKTSGLWQKSLRQDRDERLALNIYLKFLDTSL
ncbi:hypothetical protein PIB30_006933 [Stylosanthes scabra]|uniref:Uncharacterized protein n=1 Tax=Stylosanthes scabra TaxID=79078 RepID=A0ABU6X2C8_9FABA|nr:hypothetical protein [Stylosanthes scabra]